MLENGSLKEVWMYQDVQLLYKGHTWIILDRKKHPFPDLLKRQQSFEPQHNEWFLSCGTEVPSSDYYAAQKSL